MGLMILYRWLCTIMDDVHHFDDDDEKTLADKIYTSNSRSCIFYIPTCGSYLVMVYTRLFNPSKSPKQETHDEFRIILIKLVCTPILIHTPIYIYIYKYIHIYIYIYILLLLSERWGKVSRNNSLVSRARFLSGEKAHNFVMAVLGCQLQSTDTTKDAMITSCGRFHQKANDLQMALYSCTM